MSCVHEQVTHPLSASDGSDMSVECNAYNIRSIPTIEAKKFPGAGPFCLETILGNVGGNKVLISLFVVERFYIYIYVCRMTPLTR